jgi:phosphorylcholine metabolism protein LicD
MKVAVIVVTISVIVAVLAIIIVARKRYMRMIERRRKIPTRQRLAVLQKLYNIAMDAADLSGTQPFLMFGSLLGYVRQQSIICWDYDVDLGISMEQYDVFSSAIKSSPTIHVTRKSSPFNLALNIEDVETGLMLDVYPYKTTSKGDVTRPRYPNFITVYVNKEGRARWPETVFYPLRSTTFLGRSVSIPQDSTQLLQDFYGANYMTPDRQCEEPHCRNCGMN